MSAYISLITLGVADIAKATSFYEQLGFVRSKGVSQTSVSFMQAGGVVLALWGRDAQRDDALACEWSRRTSPATPKSMPPWRGPKQQARAF